MDMMFFLWTGTSRPLIIDNLVTHTNTSFVRNRSSLKVASFYVNCFKCLDAASCCSIIKFLMFKWLMDRWHGKDKQQDTNSKRNETVQKEPLRCRPVVVFSRAHLFVRPLWHVAIPPWCQTQLLLRIATCGRVLSHSLDGAAPSAWDDEATVRSTYWKLRLRKWWI